MGTRFSGDHTNTHMLKKTSMTAFALLLAVALIGCTDRQDSSSAQAEKTPKETVQTYNIAVFVPGIIAGSATYEMLNYGARQAADEFDHVELTVIEGGSNQGEWEEKVSSLAAEEVYDVILTSNPAMPAIAAAVTEKFPGQKFIVMDGLLEGNEDIYTLRYNQYQQALLAGHMAGLVTTSTMDGANQELKIGLIAGQEYPDMNELILPGYTEGAQAVHEAIEVDFRVVGNWYDAAKGAELARSMISAGADVILTIAGGANQGVLTAAAEKGVYVHWYDSNGYAQKEGTVIGSTAIKQDKAVYETLKKAVNGEITYGTADTLGLANGYITFIEDDPVYEQTVDAELRKKQHDYLESLMNQ
jgi:simple sugar transport system substrate-binding protein